MLTDWLNEECLEHAHTFCLRIHATLSTPSLSLSLSLSFWLDEQVAHTLFTGQRGGGEREREGEKEWERGRERERERSRICISTVQNCYFYFYKEWWVPWHLLVIWFTISSLFLRKHYIEGCKQWLQLLTLAMLSHVARSHWHSNWGLI